MKMNPKIEYVARHSDCTVYVLSGKLVVQPKITWSTTIRLDSSDKLYDKDDDYGFILLS